MDLEIIWNFILIKRWRRIVQKYDLKDGSYFVLAPGASKFTKKWPYYDELAKKNSRK